MKYSESIVNTESNGFGSPFIDHVSPPVRICMYS